MTMNFICSWCGAKSQKLIRHHYPIPAALGGTKVIDICGACHRLAHGRDGEASLSIIKAITRNIEQIAQEMAKPISKNQVAMLKGAVMNARIEAADYYSRLTEMEDELGRLRDTLQIG